jgi:hypothetical protein
MRGGYGDNDKQVGARRAAADRGEHRQAAGAIAIAVIRSVELIVQPDAQDGVGEMRVCGPPASPAGT